MRTLLPLLIVLLVAGCDNRPLVPLKAVVVDEAAAYPKQEPGTRPPMLTGTLSLTKEQLDEGWVQLFDGVSTYGWGVIEGNCQLSVKKRGETNFLTFERKNKEKVKIAHRFFHECFLSIENKSGNSETSTLGVGYPVISISNGGSGKSIHTHFIDPFSANPSDSKPLTEADWRPSSGETKAAWTDGENSHCLELTGGLGMVETVKEYGDFVLQLEYFTEPGVNSGVFFRCVPGETLNGYECQIFNNPPAEDYEKFIGTDTGGIFRRCVGRNVGPKDGEWNYLTIAVRGPMIATWVNGIQTVDWTDTRKEDENPRKGLRLKPGTIQLQGHDPTTKIKFRNFRIAGME